MELVFFRETRRSFQQPLIGQFSICYFFVFFALHNYCSFLTFRKPTETSPCSKNDFIRENVRRKKPGRAVRLEKLGKMCEKPSQTMDEDPLITALQNLVHICPPNYPSNSKELSLFFETCVNLKSKWNVLHSFPTALLLPIAETAR